jgi:hypothetical protein
MRPGKYENVGKSQWVLVMIDPILYLGPDRRVGGKGFPDVDMRFLHVLHDSTIHHQVL